MSMHERPMFPCKGASRARCHGAVLLSAAVQSDDRGIREESFLVPRSKSDTDTLLMGGVLEYLQDARMPVVVL